MSRQIEQALLSLMPTQGSAPPQPLVDLASSLLAQSKHRASTLKAEEEIARLYACAHLACDRLKISLDLPPIEPRPPIPPKAYKKLYAHLDQVLPNTLSRSSSGRVRTPSSKLREMQDSPFKSSGPKPLPSRATPSKERSLAAFRSPAAGKTATTPSRSAAKKQATPPLPLWMPSIIRHMCRASENAFLTPTLLAGMESIIAPSGRRIQDEWMQANFTALLAAVFYVTTANVIRITTGVKAGPKSYATARNNILTLLVAASEQVDSKGMEEESFWAGWQDITANDVDVAVKKITQSDCLDADWFKGIKDIVGQKRSRSRKGEDAEMADADEQEEDDGVVSDEQMQLWRADTMFQERYDFLSERRREDYREWKDGILLRIEQLEKNGPVAMEIDT